MNRAMNKATRERFNLPAALDALSSQLHKAHP